MPFCSMAFTQSISRNTPDRVVVLRHFIEGDMNPYPKLALAKINNTILPCWFNHLVLYRLEYFQYQVLYNTCLLHTGTNREFKKTKAHKSWPIAKPQNTAPVTPTTLKDATGLVPMDSRQRTPSVRNCLTPYTRD